MYVTNERQLADAIMKNESRIVLHKDLIDGVEKIKNPGEVVWKSVFSALVASAFFWGTASAWALGMLVGLPVILTVCGGVGGIVFVALGASGTVCAYRLLLATHTIDVLTKLRNEYTLTEDVLTRV